MYKVVGARLPAGQAGSSWLSQTGRSSRATAFYGASGGQLGPMMMASSGDDSRLYGLITLSFDDMLGQLANMVETASCFCYWL